MIYNQQFSAANIQFSVRSLQQLASLPTADCWLPTKHQKGITA